MSRVPLALLLFLMAGVARGDFDPAASIDHVILGIHDLDAGIAEFERLTGVRPVHGGKHPTGTHNALASLGPRTYVEIIAVQPGVAAPPDMAALPGLRSLTPVGWAVSGGDVEELRERLATAGMPVTDARPGSRATPAGATLGWHTFGLRDEPPAAPFFIVWAADSPHPATTSPGGCTLEEWSLVGPTGDGLERLRAALELPVTVAAGTNPSLTLVLRCPKGRVTFESRPRLAATATAAAPGPPAVPEQRPAPPDEATLPSVPLPPELDRVLRDYETAWRAKDPRALSELFAEDGFVLANGRPAVRGRAAIREAYADGGGPLHLRAYAFDTSGDVGYIIGAYSGADNLPDDGKFVLALKRGAGGRWLIMADIDNSIRRRAPGT